MCFGQDCPLQEALYKMPSKKGFLMYGYLSKISFCTHLSDSILESLFPEGLWQEGSLARSNWKDLFMSRILALSRSQADRLYCSRFFSSSNLFAPVLPWPLVFLDSSSIGKYLGCCYDIKSH